MDGNKDDAIKCLNIGKEALESGCSARALKFFNKARRLDPSLTEVEDLIAAASKDPSDSGASPAGAESAVPSSEPSSSNVPNGGPSLRSRNPPAKGADTSSGAAYTEEQVSIVRQIRRKKDYYEILGLEKSCSVEDVRKAYRKLSLKVHPDKNKAPGAEEAFKAVSKAFQCLSNEESKKKYDFTGSEEAVYERPRDGRRGFNGFYDGVEVDADEIFRNFFFGGMAPGRTGYGGFRFQTGAGPNVRTAEFNGGVGNGNLRVILQILPVLLLLLVNFYSSSEPAYSLNRGYHYDHRVLTGRGVPYYVKNSRFEQDYPYQSEKRVALENRVEREYFSIASENCRMERHRQHWGLSQKTPHCDLLKQHGVDSY